MPYKLDFLIYETDKYKVIEFYQQITDENNKIFKITLLNPIFYKSLFQLFQLIHNEIYSVNFFNSPKFWNKLPIFSVYYIITSFSLNGFIFMKYRINKTFSIRKRVNFNPWSRFRNLFSSNLHHWISPTLFEIADWIFAYLLSIKLPLHENNKLKTNNPVINAFH